MEDNLDIKSLLEWYITSGVTETCGDTCYQVQEKMHAPTIASFRQAVTD